MGPKPPAGRLTGALVAATTALLLAGCAAHEAPTRARPTTSVPTKTATASVPANLAKTRLETRRLAALARLPQSHTRLARAPKGLSGPGMGVPVSTSVVDTVRLWRVPMPLDQAQAWVQAHPPAGLVAEGRSSSSTRGVTATVGYSFSDRDTAAWVNAQLDITLAPAGPRASYWRIDGQAEWFDPTPMRDTASGPRIHVTVTGGCPRTLDHATDVTNPGVGALNRTLLPAVRPVAAVVCRYGDPFGAHWGRDPRRTLDAAAADRLAADVRAISVAHVRRGVTNCPAMTDAVTIIAFGYGSAGTVDLWWSPTGCAAIDNGQISARGDLTALTTDVNRLFR